MDAGKGWVGQDDCAVTLELLESIGCAEPEVLVRAAQNHINDNGIPALHGFARLAEQARVLCLGEMHNLEGRTLGAELVRQAADCGISTLCIEVDRREQAQLDEFLRTGDSLLLPGSLGAAPADRLPGQQLYIATLEAAQALGMRIVAADDYAEDFDGRNAAMAEIVLNCISSKTDRVLLIVGQLHLLSRRFFGHATSVATRLREALPAAPESVVTVGRAVPCEPPQFSIWARVAAVSAPTLLRTWGSPFAALPSSVGRQPLFGSDFDWLLFYPS